jgi:hypothetical protein
MAVAGNTTYFSVAASGQATLEYQWKFNGVEIPSAISPTLTLANVSAAQTGSYSVVISNGAGTTNSVAAILSVIPPDAAAILSSPVETGSQFSFVVTGINGTNYVVQASADLINWISLQTNASPFTFVDNNLSGSSQRFYRAYEAP